MNDDVVLGLHEQFPVVVGCWHHHSKDASGQAPVPGLHVRGDVVQVVPVVLNAFLRLYCHCGHLAILGVNDQRRRFSGHRLFPKPIEPIVRVGTDPAASLMALPLDRLSAVGAGGE